MNFNSLILIAGSGSIGRRHLRNLKTLGYKNFMLYRSGKSTLVDDEIKGIPALYDLKEALSYKPEAVIIANPTSLHVNVAIEAVKTGAHLFIEKPLSHNLDMVLDLLKLANKNKVIVFIGFQFRFHPLLKKIKKLLEEKAIGFVVSIQARMGEYLPSWHPWEDYTKSYSAKKNLGGGVLLTLCHPFDYLRWMIGEVKNVGAFVTKNQVLKIDTEESADVLLEFVSGSIGNVHINYIEQPGEHSLKIIGEKGVIICENLESVKLFKDGKWKKFKVSKKFERNQMYIDEMGHFLSCIAKNEQPLCTLEDGIKTLEIVLAAKKSIKEKGMVKL